MTNPKVTIAPRAYALPLLHAAKYPDAQVNGVLLGTIGANGAIAVETGIAFFHHWTSMTPMLEVALRQAELYAAKKQLKIVGWYQANPDVKDNTAHEDAKRVADTIRKNSGQALLVIVNNQKLAQLDNNTEGNAILPYCYDENQWRHVKNAFSKDSTVTLTYDDTIALVRGMFSSAAYTQLVDFDEHLEDVTRDWLEYPSKTS